MLVQSPSKRQDDKVTVRKPSVDRMEWRAQGRWGLVSEKSKKKSQEEAKSAQSGGKTSSLISQSPSHAKYRHGLSTRMHTCQHTRLLAAASTTQMHTGSNAADWQVYNENAVHLPPPPFFFFFYRPSFLCPTYRLWCACLLLSLIMWWIWLNLY